MIRPHCFGCPTVALTSPPLKVPLSVEYIATENPEGAADFKGASATMISLTFLPLPITGVATRVQPTKYELEEVTVLTVKP
ncbi:MAG: hypothetical protein ACREHF_15440 [Rhizomicrobium sp.]